MRRKLSYITLPAAAGEPAQITALDHGSARIQKTRELTAFGRVLPVDRAQRLDVPVEEEAGDDAARRAGFDAVPGAQHQRRTMELKRGQALFTRPAARAQPLQPPHQPAGIAVAPPEMRIDREKNGRLQRLSTIPKPEVMIALVIIGNGMQSVAA